MHVTIADKFCLQLGRNTSIIFTRPRAFLHRLGHNLSFIGMLKSSPKRTYNDKFVA